MGSVLVILSMCVNIIVAGYFGVRLFGVRLFGGSSQSLSLKQSFGEDTPARQILACVYLAIAIMSIWALIDQARMIDIALVLFPMQILYKLLTLISVRDRSNPVPLSNLIISILHSFSLLAIWFL